MSEQTLLKAAGLALVMLGGAAGVAGAEATTSTALDLWLDETAGGAIAARPLGADPADADVQHVHHGGRHWRRNWRRADRRAYRRAERRAYRRYRRGRVLHHRYYRPGVHGARYRRRQAAYRYHYNGWWYARPWWLVVDYNAYPRSAYVDYDYPIEYDVDGGYDPNVYERGEYASGSRCNYWSDQCVKNWGHQNPNYFGCLRYHGCN